MMKMKFSLNITGDPRGAADSRVQMWETYIFSFIYGHFLSQSVAGTSAVTVVLLIARE